MMLIAPLNSSLNGLCNSTIILINLTITKELIINNLKKNAVNFINNLPSVDLGVKLPSEDAFTGPEKAFYDFYRLALGDERTYNIVNQHGFERSALYGLHNEAIKSHAIPKTKLFELAGGNVELVGFAVESPTASESWVVPAKHFQAEIIQGSAINKPLSIIAD